MNNEIKATFYRTLNTIVETDRVDNEEEFIINNYVSRLEAIIKDEQQEILKLNNIINELENWLAKEYISGCYEELYRIGLQDGYNKLQELKGEDK